MTRHNAMRAFAGVVLVVLGVGGLLVAAGVSDRISRTVVTAYFENANGIYPGDQVQILGFPVGKIEKIEPQPERAKITFWVNSKYRIPAGASAAIISPSLVTARAVQLTPVYTSGPTMESGAVIPENRTAVPVEFDDLREQLQKLTDALQPTEPGEVSTLGAFINTSADNLRGQGANIRRTVIELSQALSILGDQSKNVFGSVKNLSILVSALSDSTDLMRQLNQNLAAVSGVLADDPDEIAYAIRDLNTAVTDVQDFVSDNRERVGIASDRLAEIAQALGDSSADLKQALHIFPTTLVNYANIYQPAQGAVTGALAGTNFSNPINFLCGAIQAASRMNAEQSAKLCVQYLAPIVKNRQYNFLGPLGFAPLVGTAARPNEITFSEDWMRPDFVPPAPAPQPQATSPDAAIAGRPARGIPHGR